MSLPGSTGLPPAWLKKQSKRAEEKEAMEIDGSNEKSARAEVSARFGPPPVLG
jgi:hypothetical protein